MITKFLKSLRTLFCDYSFKSQHLPKENFEVEITNDIDKFKIIGIQAYKKAQTSAFDYVSYKEILNETKKLQSTKTTQENDIPTKV